MLRPYGINLPSLIKSDKVDLIKCGSKMLTMVVLLQNQRRLW